MTQLYVRLTSAFKFKKKAFCLFGVFLLLIILSANSAYAQIAVTPAQTAAQLVAKLVGSGVTVSNATLVCPSNANGSFVTTVSNLGLDAGIILTAGTATGAVGSAIPSISANNNAAGDADLTTLIGSATHDACKLEFDFVPTGDTVKFRYVFGSEEYPGYACTQFNDVFAFFISGPGYPTPKNIALIPNTTIPVAINSTSGVVGTAGGNILVCNAMGTGSPFTQYYVNNTGGATVAYNGFTKILTAIATVIPCNTYHMKLAIADAIDWAVDSGVFLEAGSLSSNTLSTSTLANLQSPVPYCVRGCKNGTFSFKRQKIAAFPLTIKYLIAGTATNGVDYTLIPDSVVIPANDTVATQTIIPLTTATGVKTVKLYVYSPFSCVPPPLIIDTTLLTIYDSIYVNITTPDTNVCPGVPAQIQTVGDALLNYVWSPTTGLSSSTIKNPIASPIVPTSYMLTATLPSSTCLPVKDFISIGQNTLPIIGTEPVNTAVCLGNNTSFTLAATGTALTYQWQLSTGALFSNLTNNATYSGVTSNTLNITAPTVGMNNYQYRCVVSGTCSPRDTSAHVVLTVNTLPAIGSNPSSRVICEAANTTFVVTTTGSALVHQWQVDNGTGFTNILNGGVYAGATTSTLTITGATNSMNGNIYRCNVSGACTPALTSTSATLTVNALPGIFGNPVDKAVCPGDNTSFTTSIVGAAAAPRWQVNTGSGFTDITNNAVYSGATTTTLNITGAIPAMNGYIYRCKVSGTCTPDAFSNGATLSVGSAPSIISPPSSTPICDGGTAIFSINAAGTNLTYQWQLSTGSSFSSITNGGAYSGATTSSLVITGVTTAMSGYQYRCIVSGDCPPAITSSALTLVLTVFTLPSITSQASDSRICEGNNTSFGITATGSSIGYQWQVDNGSGYTNLINTGVYSGATSPTLTLTGTTKDMSGYQYRCVVAGTCLPNAVSIPVGLRVDTIPDITAQPHDSTVCENSPVSFSITSVGTNRTYQWEVNSGTGYTNVPNSGAYSGANTPTLNILSASPAMENNQYRCVVTGLCAPAATSTAGVLHVRLLPSVVTQPVHRIVCEGENTSYSITATGTGISSYQWQVFSGSAYTDISDNTMYAGATTNTLNITGATASMNNYYYRCVVTGACTPVAVSSFGTLTVNTLPGVIQHPFDAIICDGGNASFNIIALGTGIGYQWQVNTGSGFTNVTNNSLYSGANTNTLLITNGTATMHNYSYRCIVAGVCTPPDTSDASVLKINLLPAITSQPVDSVICVNNNATFKVVGVGAGLSYQWQVSTGSGFNNISNGGSYSGVATNTLLVTGGTVAMDGYLYRCILSGTCTPTVTTNAARLTVNTPPFITSQSPDSTICEGSDASFSVAATGTALTYQWKVDIGFGFQDVVDGGIYSGATTNTLTLTGVSAAYDFYQYRCIVSGVCFPSGFSSPVTLRVRTLPNITSQPADKTICYGANTSFATTATGTAVSYQWQVNNGSGFTNVTDGAVYAGAATGTLSLTVPPTSMNGNLYRCVVSGSCTPQAITNSVLLTVNGLPAINSNPANATICEGDNTSFNVSTSGTGIIYKWQVDVGSGFTDVVNSAIYSGASAATLSLTAPPASMSTYQYRCIVSGTCTPAVISSNATLIINTLPAVTSQPANNIICEGADAIFAVTATGTNHTYQWQVNTGSGFTNVSNNSIYAGSTSATLYLTAPPASMNSYLYRCIVSGTCTPAVNSNTVSLTINILPVVLTEPTDSTICEGGDATFRLNAGGTALVYKWQVDNGSGFNDVVNNAVYSGASTSVLLLSAPPASMSGLIYRCIVSGTCLPRDTTIAATITINTLPAISTQPIGKIVCEGDNLNYSVEATGTNHTYQWQVNTGSGFTNVSNGGLYSGVTSDTLKITFATAGMSGYVYRCTVSGTCPPAVTSAAAPLTVRIRPVITSQPHDSTICTGNNASFTLAANGTGISYQWQVNTGSGFADVTNGGVYNGATTNTLSITNGTVPMDGYQYRCLVPGACTPTAISDTVLLHISTPPAITTPPTSTPICDGGTTIFSIGTTGTNLTYQWQLNTGSGYSSITNGSTYSGATTSSLVISGVTPAMSGYQYQCIVSGDCPPAITSGSLTLVLTVYTLPSITSQAGDRRICEGSNTSYTIAGAGTGIGYQWQVDDGNGYTNVTNTGVYTGATSPTLNLTAATKDMSGYQYRCVVAGTCLPDAISIPVGLRVDTMPVVTIPPHDSTVCDGSAVSFGISAVGTSINYQWQVNNGTGYTNVPNTGIYSGANSSELLMSATALSMEGYQYRCVVTGTCTPPAISSAGVLHIRLLPLVGTQPLNRVICVGDNTNFSIAATGTGISYQWQVNAGSGYSNIINNTMYGGATTNTLTVAGVIALMDNYYYRCVVTGVCTPQAISSFAILTVNTLPDITLQPVDSTICDGNNASFSISATGTTITYQWQVNSGSGYTSITNNSLYSGATTNKLLITGGTASMHNYSYRCIVSGVCTPPDTSAAALLKINILPAVTTQPSDITICEGNNATFTMAGVGTGVAYQWQINTGSGYIALPNGGAYSGGTTNTLLITGAIAAMDGYLYRCVLTGTCNPQSTTNGARLTVNTSPAITTQPKDSTMCEGSNATFAVVSTGTALAYQWQVNTGSGFANLSNGGVYSGATTNILLITAGTFSMHNYQYRCIVSGTCPPSVMSNTGILKINALPLIVTQAKDSTICDGGDASFTISATGTAISYQWQVNNGAGFANVSNSTLYSGATTNTLLLTAANAGMHNYQYRCVVSGTCTPAAVSAAVLLKVNTLPNITLQPKDSTLCQWQDASFTIAATGTGITYQWQVDDGNGFADVISSATYSGVTTPQLYVAAVPIGMHNYQYRCIVAGTCTPPDTSNPAYLKVNTAPVITLNPLGSTICEGSNTTFNITATGTSLTYQWQVDVGGGYLNVVNNSMYSGAATNSLSITATISGMNNYQYRCIVTGTCTPADTSNPATLNIYTAPVVTSSPVNRAICPGEKTTFSVTATGTNVSYQWQEDLGNGFVDVANTADYAGAYTGTLTILDAKPAMNNRIYRCRMSGSCTPLATSGTAVLTVYPKEFARVTTNKSPVFCMGDSVLLTGDPSTGVSYQWQKNDVSIPGAISRTYRAHEVGEYKLVIYNDFCYSSSDSVNVWLNPLPMANIYINGIKVICPDSAVELRAVEALNTTFEWQWNYQRIPGATSSKYIADKPGIYNVVATNDAFCVRMSDTVMVNTDPGPKPLITTEKSILCTGNFAAYQWFIDSDTVLNAVMACYSAKRNGAYTVLVTNDNGCSAYSSEFLMKDVGKDYVLVSPNPASDVININTSLVVNVTLSTMEGKILMRQERTKTIDISNLPDGAYMLRVFSQDNDMVRAERIIKVSK